MRCSSESQLSGDTWERQIEKIHALAARQGFEIEHEWREEGVSGKVECEQRPAFQAMLAHLLSNGCRTIIVEDLSRLARRYAVQEQILLYLCAKGITLWTCANGGQNITEEMNQDPTKRLLIGIVGLVSQWEREQLVEKLKIARMHNRVKNGLEKGYTKEEAAKFGKCEGRKAFGEHPEKPEEKPILDRMIQMKESGQNPEQIAQTFNSEGIPTRGTKKGKGPWKAATIAKILNRNR
jgi:DNA invertase Pin-like site-specific DNA recombinase